MTEWAQEHARRVERGEEPPLKIGQVLRIRLPNNYTISNGFSNLPPRPEWDLPAHLTLEDFKRVVDPILAAQCGKLLLESNALLDWMGPLPKLTRWQRLRRRWRSTSYRVRDAWLVLIGRAEIDHD